MTTTSLNGETKKPLSSLWDVVSPYVTPPLAAGAAIVLPFRLLIQKSDLQQEKLPLSPIKLKDGLKAGLRTAPTVSLIVGGQMVLEGQCKKLFGANTNSFLSAALVGFISAPILIAFNGQTMGKGVWNSLSNMSKGQWGATVFQETAFVAGLGAADMVSETMKGHFGDNKVVEYSAAFLSAAAGSLAGHPANTTLTRWQAGMPVKPAHLMLGAVHKTVAVGIFGVLYKAMRNCFNSTS